MILSDPSPLVIPRDEMFARDGTARVETTTLLPDGTVATLTLRRRGECYTVDDEGGARAALAALGVQYLTRADVRRGTDIAGAFGVMFVNETFRVPDVAQAQLQAAITFVAEASRKWASSTLDVRRRSGERDVTTRAVEKLRTSFPTMEIQTERELPGASTKLHRFDVVVSLPGERFAIFETLLPTASSIAAAHLKFYDLKRAHGDWPRQAIVESLSEWASEDLAILQQVTSGIRSVDVPWDDLRSLAA